MNRRRFPPKEIEKQCDKTTPHYQHGDSKGRDWVTCPGIPFPINRKSYTLTAYVKRPFAIARQGRLIHGSESRAYLSWLPRPHEWGFWSQPELVVKLKCRYPSYIRRPVLLDANQADQLISNGQQITHGLGTTWCPHCFPGDASNG